MTPVLDDLIERFRRAQDTAVDILVHKLSIPRPASNREWVFYCAKNGLHESHEVNDITFTAHGYGIAIEIGAEVIDFDWGDHGEPDGFDGWRLYLFSTRNCPDFNCTHEQLNAWLKNACDKRELIELGSLYYDPKRRAAT